MKCVSVHWSLQTARRVLLAFRTEEYRQAVVHNVDPTHVCVEIGCHEGERATSTLNRV